MLFKELLFLQLFFISSYLFSFTSFLHFKYCIEFIYK